MKSRIFVPAFLAVGLVWLSQAPSARAYDILDDSAYLISQDGEVQVEGEDIIVEGDMIQGNGACCAKKKSCCRPRLLSGLFAGRCCPKPKCAPKPMCCPKPKCAPKPRCCPKPKSCCPRPKRCFNLCMPKLFNRCCDAKPSCCG